MDWRDCAVLIFGGLLVLYHVVRLVTMAYWHPWLQSLPAALRGLANKIRRMYTCKKPPEDIESLVAMAVSNSRLDYFRDYSTANYITMGVLIARMCVQRIQGQDRLHTIWQDALVLLFYLLVSIVAACPKLLNTKNMDIWYSLWMLILTIYSAPFANNAEYFPIAHMYAAVETSIVSIGCLGSPLVLFWNAASLASAWASTQAFGGDHLVRVFGGRVVLTILTCAFAFLVESRWREQARRETEAQLLKETSSGFHALMRRFYDLVTELDANLVITASGRELSSFLQSETVPSLEGVRFDELINCDEQRELFLQRTQQPLNESEGVADMLHMTLRFGTGHMRQVELFTFQFPSIVGRRRFLLGIRDCGEQTILQPGVLPTLPAADNLGDIHVTVNSLIPNLPIVSCSSGLQHLVDIQDTSQGTEGIELGDFVSNFSNFESWLQNVMNLHHSGSPEGVVQRANRGKVKLKLRRQHAPGFLHYEMKCQVVFQNEGHNAGDLEVYMQNVQLQFTRWKRARTQRSALSSNSSSSSSSGSSESRGTPRSLERRTLSRGLRSI